MRRRLIAALAMSLLVAAGCSRKTPSELAQALGPLQKDTTTVATPEAPQAEPPPSGFDFVRAGLPYPEARKILLSHGFEAAPDKVRNPRPGYPDIDCFGERPYCQANFTELQTQGYHAGWKQYAVILVSNDAVPIVTYADYATTADGLPDIPPPEAPDIPKVDKEYMSARQQLLALGYKTIDSAKDTWEGCALADDLSGDCSKPIPMPEVGNCSGTGLSFCQTYWRAPDGRLLFIETLGEPPPRLVYYMRWGTPEDLKDIARDQQNSSDPYR